jgi:Methane oxygenase PmoA
VDGDRWRGARTRIRPLLSALAVIAILALLPAALLAETIELEVSAGRHPRRDTPVSLEVEGAVSAAALVEVDPKGERPVPVQLEPAAAGRRARAHWILSGETPAGTVRRFRLALAGTQPAEVSRPLELLDDPGKALEVRLGGRSVLRYNYGKVLPPDASIPPIQTRNAYLHPLWSPGGQVLTMDYPRNHLHHRGVWFPWVKTEFEGRHPDFWNLGDGTGTVEFESLEARQSGPVFAGFRARHRHLDLKSPGGPRAALTERWDVRVYAVGGERAGYFLFDLESTQECAGTSPLKLDEYRYGGLGLRGSWDWEGDNARVFTSEGKGRLNGEGAPARWFDVEGPVAGRWAGITVLGHPTNFRAPQPVRVHPTEPFLNFAPVKSGGFEIAPGKPFVSRYRFYLHDGVLKADEAERLFTDYAEPPEVRAVRGA